MTSISKIRITGFGAALLFSLALAFMGGRAEAVSPEICTIKAVSFQQTTGSPGEALVIYCTDNTFYMAFIGNPVPACNLDIGTVQVMQSLAVAARLAGRQISITNTDTTCVGKTIHIITGVNLS